MNLSQELQVIIVMKTGGDFVPSHVDRLISQIKTYLTVPHEIFCLTDIPGEYVPGITVLPLLDNLPGWWSKIEVFRSFTNVLYFDLDTTIKGNIDFLAKEPNHFLALRSKYRNMGSGIMRWYGDFSGLYKFFIQSKEGHIKYFSWDQEYINSWLVNNNIQITYLQTLFPGKLMSFKNEYLPAITCEENEMKERLKNPPIIYFHGKPRPWDIQEIT